MFMRPGLSNLPHTIIANQEAEIAQLRKEDQALLNTLDSLSDSINLLTNEIELLQDKLEDSDSLPDNYY